MGLAPVAGKWELGNGVEEIGMKSGDRVRVKLVAKVERHIQGKTGTVISNSLRGEAVLVSLDCEGKDSARQFLAEDLERID